MTNQCNAIGCQRAAGKDAWMCREHWNAVPKHIRDRLLPLARKRDWSSPLAMITLALARREVGLAEGTYAVDEAKRLAEIERWIAGRDKLRHELGEFYERQVDPYRERLRKLLEMSGGGDPLEVAALAIKFDRADVCHNARRVAAAVDLYELAMGKG